MAQSPIELLASLPADQRETILSALAPEETAALLHDWRSWARPDQVAPDWPWRFWLILAGRGYGKTRSGAEYVREEVEAGRAGHVALVGPTAADVRDTMIEGESGLLNIFPPDRRPKYEPSKRRLTFHTGATATTFSADKPDRLRGPNHDLAWADELAAWRYPEAWDMLVFGLRIGEAPRAVVTTTPRPIALVKNLLDRADVHVTKGSTFDNRANLAPAFLDEVTARYEGTRLGRQELHAEILDDVEGALWDRDQIDTHRVREAPADLTRVVVAVDPAISTGGDETGIVAAGIDADGHGYVLDDGTLRGSPTEWARRAVDLYRRHQADRIVAEGNQGGDMVTHTLRTVDPDVPVRLVHASRGKRTRAEPVAALAEQGRIHHVGSFPALEDQLCSWVPGDPSPDRLDALVWAFTHLIVDGQRRPEPVVPFSAGQQSPWAIR